MPSQKLVAILKTLDKQDWRDFSRYVSSPFFNRNERLIAFVDLLRKEAPDFSEEKLSKERIHRTLYGPKAAFQEQQVYDHISFLMRQLEGYLAYRQYQDDEAMEGRYLLNAFAVRNLPEHFERASRKLKKKHQRQPQRNARYHLARFFAEREANQLAILTHQPDYLEITARMVDHLDRFYIASKLEYGCNDRIMRQMWKHGEEDPFLKAMIRFLEDEGQHYLQDPLIRVYYHIYKTLGPGMEGEENYRTLVEILSQDTQAFTREETYGLYIYAQNYVSRQLNAGKPGYLEEIFRLYQEMLRKKVFLINGYLDAGVYKNMVTVGLRLREFAWVDRFLGEYRSYLHPTHQNAAYHLNLAAYHYARRDYSKALRELLQTDLVDVDYHLNVRRMQLQIYFEQEEEEALYSLLEAFSSYLKRNKQLSDTKLRAYRNLIRFIRKASRLRQRSYTLDEDTFEKQKNAFLEEIGTAPDLPNRSWLEARVEDY